MRPTLDSVVGALALTRVVFPSFGTKDFFKGTGLRPKSDFFFRFAGDIGAGSGFLAQALIVRVIYGLKWNLFSYKATRKWKNEAGLMVGEDAEREGCELKGKNQIASIVKEVGVWKPEKEMKENALPSVKTKRML